MPVNKEQDESVGARKNLLWKWMRRFLIILTMIIGIVGIGIFLLVLYAAFFPVNLTYPVKYWMPVSIIPGKDPQHPAGRLDLGHLTIEWPVFKEGFSAPLVLEVRKLEICDHDGKVRDHLDYGQVRLQVRPLFKGEITPLSVAGHGAGFYLKRLEDKKVVLDLPDQGNSHDSALPLDMTHLRHVQLRDGVLQLIDEKTHALVQLNRFDINVVPFHYHNVLALMGHVRIGGQVNGHPIGLEASSSAESMTDAAGKAMLVTGKLGWHVQFSQLNPADFAGILSGLEGLDRVNLPVSLKADIGFDMQNHSVFQPETLDLDMALDKGVIIWDKQKLYPSSGKGQIHIRGLFKDGQMKDGQTNAKKGVSIQLPFFDLQLRSPSDLGHDKSGPIFHFKGNINLSDLLKPQEVQADLTAFSPLLSFSSLKDYWPASVAKGAYAWVTENITAGEAHDFSIHAGLTGTQGWHDLKLTALTGGIRQAKGLEIHWLRPVPPLRDMNAQMRFIDPDRLLIEYQGGYQLVYPSHKETANFHKLAVPEGKMWITGLDDHEETGIILPVIQGKLEDLLTLLAEPRLRLLSRHPLPFKNPSGKVYTTLHIELPLKKKVKIEQVFIQGHNEIKDAYLGDVALGQDLKQASMIVDVDARHLELTGQGLFASFPSSFRYMQDFYHDNDASLVEQAQAKIRIDQNSLQKAGFDTGADFQGDAFVLMNYAKHYDQQARIDLKFDFLHAAFGLPIWHKTKEDPMMVSGTVLLKNNKLMAIHDLQAVGKDLKIQAGMNITHSVPEQLNIQSFKLGRSMGKATLNFPMTKEAFHDPLKGDVRISVKADQLDISPFVHQYLETKKSRNRLSSQPESYKLPIAATGRYDGPRGRRWIVNLQAGKVYYDKDKDFGSVTAYMEYNGIRLSRLSYGMRKPVLVTASLFPQNQNRSFYLDAQNLGEILKIIGISTQISGGHLVLKGQFKDTDPEAPFTGTLNVEPFLIKKAPNALQYLSKLSIYGLFKDQKKDEIGIDALKGKVDLNKGILKIRDGRVYNNEMGATLQGDINLDEALLDLQGTIVPVYVVNQIFSHLPAVGKLFVPEKGGGFVAVPFEIKGKFADPEMEIHSSGIFTPGILRQLFLNNNKKNSNEK